MFKGSGFEWRPTEERDVTQGKSLTVENALEELTDALGEVTDVAVAVTALNDRLLQLQLLLSDQLRQPTPSQPSN